MQKVTRSKQGAQASQPSARRGVKTTTKQGVKRTSKEIIKATSIKRQKAMRMLADR